VGSPPQTGTLWAERPTIWVTEVTMMEATYPAEVTLTPGAATTTTLKQEGDGRVVYLLAGSRQFSYKHSGSCTESRQVRRSKLQFDATLIESESSVTSHKNALLRHNSKKSFIKSRLCPVSFKKFICTHISLLFSIALRKKMCDIKTFLHHKFVLCLLFFYF
jgi:hypothetical protein